MQFSVISQGQPQSVTYSFLCVAIHNCYIDLVPQPQKAKPHGFPLHQQSSNFLAFFPLHKYPLQPTSPFITAQNCSCSYSPLHRKTIKYHLFFLEPRLLLGKRTSALKYHMSQIKPPVTCPSDTKRSCPIAHSNGPAFRGQTS